MIASHLGGGQGEVLGSAFPVAAAQAAFAFDKIQFGQAVTGGLQQLIQFSSRVRIKGGAVQGFAHGQGVSPAFLSDSLTQSGQRVALAENSLEKFHLLPISDDGEG
jgi:hypothetical protein